MTQPPVRESVRGEASRLGREAAPNRKLFGLVELDSAGTVLYMRSEADGATPDYTGRNFYTEVAPFTNTLQLKERIESFSRGSQPAHSIDFICEYEDGPLLVRVLLARIRERYQADTTKSILVHIRRAQ